MLTLAGYGTAGPAATARGAASMVGELRFAHDRAALRCGHQAGARLSAR